MRDGRCGAKQTNNGVFRLQYTELEHLSVLWQHIRAESVQPCELVQRGKSAASSPDVI